MRIIDADALKQKYIMATTRYSGGIMERPVVLIEAIDEAPTVRTKQIKYYDDDEKVWKIGEVIVSDSEKPNNSMERSSE